MRNMSQNFRRRLALSVLCSSTGASSGELCFGSHALKNAAVGILQHIADALGARAESLRQKCNAGPRNLEIQTIGSWARQV